MFAMCWKCCNKITQELPRDPNLGVSASTLIGCKAELRITDFNSAQKLCPLQKEVDNLK